MKYHIISTFLSNYAKIFHPEALNYSSNMGLMLNSTSMLALAHEHDQHFYKVKHFYTFNTINIKGFTSAEGIICFIVYCIICSLPTSAKMSKINQGYFIGIKHASNLLVFSTDSMLQ